MSERPRRFTEVIAMLTSIDKDDSGGESETEEGDVLDCQLCSSNETNDDEKLSNLMMHNPLFILVIYKLLILTLKSFCYSATCYNDDSGSGAAESSSTNDTVRDGTKC